MAKHLAILALLAILLSAKASDPGYRPVGAPGLQNVFAITPNLYSGSSPSDDQSFKTLQSLGIKTIISVDGAKPDLIRAHQFGLRYIHLPHGYDGIPANTQLQLSKAAEVTDGPIYIHCHHGKHRGPAAAAIICMTQKGWTPAQAETWLHAAGTSTNYLGLYKTIREFQAPTADQLKSTPSTFPEIQKTSGLIDAMVAIDHQFENLQAIRKANYKTPPDHPDLVPANEALLLKEHFRELQRTPESKALGQKFLTALRNAELESQSLQTLLNVQNAPRESLDKSITALANDCATCHKTFRDD